MSVKLKVNYTESEFQEVYYLGKFIVDEIIKDGCWLIEISDKKKIFPRKYCFQLKGIGEEPPFKKGQIIKIVITTPHP